jgi:hypothetical protein
MEISEKDAAEYSKAISTQEKRNRELTQLFQARLPALSKAGLNLETMNLARNLVAGYLCYRNSSAKGIARLLAAAICVKANGETTFGLWKHRGEGISEERLEEIFGTNRKTIRKWKKMFEEPFLYMSQRKL